MSNIAETGRVAALSAMMVGVNGANLAPKYDTSGLPAGAIELKVDMPRIAIDAPVVLFDQADPSPLASPLPPTDPIANLDNCLPGETVPVAAVDGAIPEASPAPDLLTGDGSAASPQPDTETAEELTEEQTAVAQEDCEPITTYDSLVDLLTSEDNPDIDNPEININELSNDIAKFFGDLDEFQLEIIKREFGDTPKKLLEKSINELGIEGIDGRNPEVVSKPLEAMLATFFNTESEAMLGYIQDYIIFTRGQMPEKYTNNVLIMLDGWKLHFDELDAKKANNGSGNETPEATIPDPDPDTILAVMNTKIDIKATIPKVIAQINNLYSNDEYKEPLKSLRSIYDYTPLTKKDLIDYLKKCNNVKSLSEREIRCIGIITDFIFYAAQIPTDSEIEANIHNAIIKAAKTLRSATVNAGVSVNKIDKELKAFAEQYSSN